MTEEQMYQAVLELRHLVDKYSLTERDLEVCSYHVANPYLVTYYNAAGQVLSRFGYRNRPTLEEALEHIAYRLETKLVPFSFATAEITYHGSDDIEDWNKPIIVVLGDGQIILGKELCDETITKNLDVLKIA